MRPVHIPDHLDILVRLRALFPPLSIFLWECNIHNQTNLKLCFACGSKHGLGCQETQEGQQ